MGHSDRALVCVEEAYKLDSEDHREGKKAIRLSQKAAVLIALGEDIAAEKCLLQAIPILQEKNNITSMAICQNQLGQLYYKSELYQHAEKAYMTACEQATKAGSDYVKKKGIERIVALPEASGKAAGCAAYIGRIHPAFGKDR